MYMAQNLQNHLFLQYYCFFKHNRNPQMNHSFSKLMCHLPNQNSPVKEISTPKGFVFFSRNKDVQLVKLFQFCLAMPQIKDLADIHRTLVISESGVLLQPLCLSKLD